MKIEFCCEWAYESVCEGEMKVHVVGRKYMLKKKKAGYKKCPNCKAKIDTKIKVPK